MMITLETVKSPVARNPVHFLEDLMIWSFTVIILREYFLFFMIFLHNFIEAVYESSVRFALWDTAYKHQ